MVRSTFEPPTTTITISVFTYVECSYTDHPYTHPLGRSPFQPPPPRHFPFVLHSLTHVHSWLLQQPSSDERNARVNAMRGNKGKGLYFNVSNSKCLSPTTVFLLKPLSISLIRSRHHRSCRRSSVLPFEHKMLKALGGGCWSRPSSESSEEQ